jgi:hypothetical protein
MFVFKQCVQNKRKWSPISTFPVATLSKSWVGDSSFAGVSGSNPAAGMSFGSYQVEISVSGLSLVQRSPTECGVPECNRDASTFTLRLPN